MILVVCLRYAARNCLRKQFFQKAYLSLTSKSNTMDIKTFVFFDSETTGLPHLENNRTRMTELCFTAVQSDHIKLGIYPRIQNKVSFCFNPRKFINPEASEITGLSNELLEYQSTFNENAVNAIKNFLSLLREPVCLVAHNGNRFDFPILRAEIHKTGNELSEDILCVDSLLAFRQLHQQEVQDINKTIQTQEAREAELPIEFQDGFDELLCSIAEDVERSSTSTSTKLTVAEIQKINETTPTKNIIRGVTHVMKSNKIKVIQKKQNGTGPLRQLDFG